jgi:hypothetical protein
MFQDRWNSAKQAELKDRVTHTRQPHVFLGLDDKGDDLVMESEK